MDANLELIRRVSRAQTRFAITVDQWSKTVRLAADDRDHQGQPERAGANQGAGRAADTKPNRQRVLQRARVNSLPGKRRAVLARPVNVCVLADVKKQIEFLGKERIVFLEFKPEERKRFDESAAPGDDLGTSLREQVERSELLEHAHRVGRAQHGDGAR